MLNDATCFKAVYIVCGYTDLRAGMDRLAALVETQTGNRPYIKDTLYLFCGRRTDRIKGLVWEGDGWLLLYKRLSESRFQWPRTPEDVRGLTPQQFRWLMEGLTITPKKSVRRWNRRNTWDDFVQNGEVFGRFSCWKKCPALFLRNHAAHRKRFRNGRRHAFPSRKGFRKQHRTKAASAVLTIGIMTDIRQRRVRKNPVSMV